MSDGPPSDLAERVQRLERVIMDLRSRVTALERQIDPRSDHPADNTVVREKVTYDWQS